MRAVNLLPRDDPRRKKVPMTVGTQLALVAPFVVASLIVAGYLLESSKVNDNRATLKALVHEFEALPPPQVTPTDNNAELAAQQSQRVSALSSALQGRVAWDRILREISSVLPEDVWLTTLSATSEPNTAPPPTPPPPAPTSPSQDGENETTTTTTTTPAPVPAAPVAAGASLNLSGYTYSQEGVARFLGRLAVIPELQNVRLVSSIKAESEGRAVVQFTITGEVRRAAAA